MISEIIYIYMSKIEKLIILSSLVGTGLVSAYYVMKPTGLLDRTSGETLSDKRKRII